MDKCLSTEKVRAAGKEEKGVKDVKEGRDNRVKPTTTENHHNILRVHFNCPKLHQMSIRMHALVSR